VLDGQLRLVLLSDIGQAVVTADYPAAILEHVLKTDYSMITASI
jgi:3-dehydroquinate synthase